MNSNESGTSGLEAILAAIESLNERLQRVEQHLGMEPVAFSRTRDLTVQSSISGGIEAAGGAPAARQRESLEFELGQNWFALIGIVVLAVGVAFLLSLPYANLPAAVPALGGYALSGFIVLLARLSRRSFDAVSRYLRGAGMLLLFFSTLRLLYFGEPAALEADSAAAQGLFLLVLVFNLATAWRRKSPQLFILALATGFAMLLAVDRTGFLLVVGTLLILVAGYAQLRMEWRMLVPVVFSMAMITYAVWMIGNPVVGNPVGPRAGPVLPVLFIPVWIICHSIVLLARRDCSCEDTPVQVSGLLLCGLGFAVFFLHNLMAFDAVFLVNHLILSAVFIVLAVVFWVREESAFSTFIYAMTGYAALSFALIKAFGVPEVFVALSLQSLVVIATAIYFRNRFIIVANCLIFIGIIMGYMLLARAEQGMSIGFGVVALVTARVLNWQKDRLALRTELMRVVYLAIAFLVFPYALFYLVPHAFVAVAWVGLALFYYGLNLIIRNRRYRWMGHMTLLLTVLYVAIVGTRELDIQYRILSFLVLGSIMLVVSLVFTAARARRKRLGTGEERE